MKPDLCIYHGNCDDGFGAAWAVHRRWPEGVEYFPAFYGQPPPDVSNKSVLIVDFSYKYDVLIEMARQATHIIVLDHHKTAQADLARFPKFNGTEADEENAAFECKINNGPETMAHFDMESSGAVQAWRYCHGSWPPEMLMLIEDRDLWRFYYGDRTKQFSAALRTYPHDFAVWDDISQNPEALIHEGKAILRGHMKNVHQICEQAYTGTIDRHNIPMVNAPYHYASDCAHELLQRFPDAPFTAAWFHRADGKRQYSLQSEDHRMDVSEVAKSFGGGGHRNAAGFEIKL